MCVHNVSFICLKHGGLLIQSYMPNFSLAFMLFLTIRSVSVSRSGSLSILQSSCDQRAHLSFKSLALPKSMSWALAIPSNRLMPGSPRASRFSKWVPGPMY